MFEKVNPSHPDKIADRIAGALVDLAYSIARTKGEEPKIAVEVLIGHGKCTIISETSEHLPIKKVKEIVKRITQEKVKVEYREFKQDIHLAKNQEEEMRCGDNGIFKGVPLTEEERFLTSIVQEIYPYYYSDGKYIINIDDRVRQENYIICQSRVPENTSDTASIKGLINHSSKYPYPKIKINPLGYWTGGINVDTGCTNRKLGSDMGGSVTGGGLHGKDFSKADVSCNIYAFLKAQNIGKKVEVCCAIGDTSVKVFVDGKFEQYVPYKEIVALAEEYISILGGNGGFEQFAEWGLINGLEDQILEFLNKNELFKKILKERWRNE